DHDALAGRGYARRRNCRESLGADQRPHQLGREAVRHGVSVHPSMPLSASSSRARIRAGRGTRRCERGRVSDMSWAMRGMLSCPDVLQRTWIMQFGFSNYTLILVGFVSDPVCWLSANYLEPGKNSEVISAIEHDLSDLEPVQGGHDPANAADMEGDPG